MNIVVLIIIMEELALHLRGGGVKKFWKEHLGDFREEDRILISSLLDKGVIRIAIDVSAWMHNLDGVTDVKYARTSNPRYVHPTVINTYAARHRALKALGIKPIYVFDGISPNIKKRTNRVRKGKSDAAREQYQDVIKEIDSSMSTEVTEEQRTKLFKAREDMARPIIEEYTALSKWMEEKEIDYVQAPFEADAQIAKLIEKKVADAALTEDGDFVVFGVPHILSRTKVETGSPETSTCQYFNIEDLRNEKYNSPIVGRRLEYLAEISCLAGNDYIDNIPYVGPTKIFGTAKRKKDQTALIDSFIDDTVTNNIKTEREWLEEYCTANRRKRKKDDGDAADDDDDDESLPENWSVDRFINVRNAIKHYPIFVKNEQTGEVTLEPLNPLPTGVEWGSYIGFDKDPSEYFSSNDYKQYYSMRIISSADKPRHEKLGPVFTENDNPLVAAGTPLPLFAKLDDPLDFQPISVLRAYLLARGIALPQNVPDEKIRELAQTAHEVKRRVVDPSMLPDASSWVSFEPLDPIEMGDKYDEWVSTMNYILLCFTSDYHF